MEQESERSQDAQRKREKRARERDIIIPPIVDRERRLRLEQDDRAWLRHYNPKAFYNEFTDQQAQSLRSIAEAVQYGTKKCIAGPRGDGKTALTRYRLGKGLLRKHVDGEKRGRAECPFALYVGASDPKASQSDQAIRRWLRTGCISKPGNDREFIANSPLGEDYPFECAVLSYVSKAPSRANNVTTNGGWRIHVQWANNLIMPSLEFGDEDEAWEKWMIRPGVLGAMLLACGITGSVLQGANIFDQRPTAVVLDDLDNRESLAADKKKSHDDGTVAKKIGEIIDKTISGMQGQGQSMGQVMLCTVTTRKSVAFRYSDPMQEPSWSGIRNKRVIKWPDRMNMWETYMTLRRKGKQAKDDQGNTVDPHAREAHQYFIDNMDEMLEGAVLGNYNIHDETPLPDGSKTQVHTLQWCFDFIADNDLESFNTEYQQEPPEDDDERLNSQLTSYHVADSVIDRERGVVDETTAFTSSGIDVRKIELHELTIAQSDYRKYQIPDYDAHSHGTTEITPEMAERAIYKALHKLADWYDGNPMYDVTGSPIPRGVTLVDKGWLGSWTDDDGSNKSWATQPVETFCMEKGLRWWLPAKGQPKYKSPAPADDVIIGTHWHINRGEDRYSKSKRACTEVIWDVKHYREEIEKAFQMDSEEEGITLFTPVDGIHVGHRRLTHHMLQGVKGLVEMRMGKTPKTRREHWWDALAMAIVARSVELWFHQNLGKKKTSRSRSKQRRNQQPQEIGAR